MTVNLRESLPREAVALADRAEDWREAVRRAGELLVDVGAAKPEYTDAIVAVVEDLGPYIVLAPGIAIAHARPEDGAKGVGFALVRFIEPVEFGSRNNDPVDLVFAFASPDADVHVKALASLAQFIESRDNVSRLRAADTADDLYTIIEEAAS